MTPLAVPEMTHPVRLCLICRGAEAAAVHKRLARSEVEAVHRVAGQHAIMVSSRPATLLAGKLLFLHDFDPGERRSGPERREGKLPMPASMRSPDGEGAPVGRRRLLANQVGQS